MQAPRPAILTLLILLFLSFSASACDAVGDLFGNEKEAKGIIEEVGANYLVVEGIRYEVNDKTKYEGVSGLAGLTVGARVEIDYEEHGSTRVATEIDAGKGD